MVGVQAEIQSQLCHRMGTEFFIGNRSYTSCSCQPHCSLPSSHLMKELSQCVKCVVACQYIKEGCSPGRMCFGGCLTLDWCSLLAIGSTPPRFLSLATGSSADLSSHMLFVSSYQGLHSSSLACAGMLPVTIGQAAATADPTAGGGKTSDRGRVGGNPRWGEACWWPHVLHQPLHHPIAQTNGLKKHMHGANKLQCDNLHVTGCRGQLIMDVA